MQRKKATPTGVRKVSDFSMNKNDAPQIIPNAMYVGSQLALFFRGFC
jgi:hypothetical protein